MLKRRYLVGTLLVVGIVLVALTLWERDTAVPPAAGSQFLPALPQQSTGGFARAVAPYDWDFPRDHGPHPNFQTEWWYYTGNVVDVETGERFGYQFTIFRRALSPDAPDPMSSEWRSNQIYMAHFTVTDVARTSFYHEERLSRAGAGLAGAEGAPRYNIWLENWEIRAEDEGALTTSITADARSFAIDLTHVQQKPPALQGDRGLSPKSGEVGNASYYYSLSQLRTNGTIRIGSETYNVTGKSWMDHEFSTSALGPGAQGWDWFGLQFDDGREIMLGQIRLIEGGVEPAFGGLLIEADGSTRYLSSSDFTIEATASWVSPHSGAEYPAQWEMTVAPEGGPRLSFTVTPLIADQELHGSGIVYWEGAVQISGDVSGYGYAELTGYHDVMQGRF